MPDARGPFTGKLGFGRSPALVVIDMVTAYTDPSSDLYMGPHGADVVASIVALIDAARDAGIPVIYTGVSIAADGSDAGIFFRKVPSLAAFQPGSAFSAFVPEIQPLDHETVLMKQYPSAMWGTPLAAMLVAAGVDTVVLCGVSTSGCVRATACDAMQHGFIPIVVREAVGDRHREPHEANLFDIDAKIGDVVALDEALAHLGHIGAP